MSGVLQGFAVLAVLVGVGVLLAHVGVLDTAAQNVLSRLVYFVAAPCLLISLLASTDVSHVLGAGFAVALLSVLVVVVVYVVAARLRGWSVSHTVVGSLASSYANAGYIGLPIAAYVLGDASFALPVMVLQLVVYAPAALAVLEVDALGRRPTLLALAGAGARNPVTIGAAVGVVLSLLHVQLPDVLARPLDLLGSMAVPAALLAYGVSLRLGGAPRWREARHPWFVAVLKLGLQPLAAYLLARFVLRLDPLNTFGVTVMAALPTAQNVFVYASRFGRSVTLARDAIAITTILSVPVLLLLAVLLA